MRDNVFKRKDVPSLMDTCRRLEAINAAKGVQTKHSQKPSPYITVEEEESTKDALFCL